MDADSWGGRGVPNVMSIVRSECARVACMDNMDLSLDAMLLQNPGCNDECTRGRAVIVEACGLPGKPANQPHVMVGCVVKPFVPALVGAQPHSFDPCVRGRELSNDVGEFLLRSRYLS